MLAPKKVKWRKQMKGKMRGLAKGATTVDFGEYGLQALSCGFVTSRQIEAARIAISRHVKRGGKLYIRIFRSALYKKPERPGWAREGEPGEGPSSVPARDYELEAWTSAGPSGLSPGRHKLSSRRGQRAWRFL